MTKRELITFQLYHNNLPGLISQRSDCDYHKITVLWLQIEYSIATSTQSDYYLHIKTV